MADNTLSFETRVDLSGLESGMSAASSTVNAGAQKMAQAMSVAKNEAAALGQAYKVMGTMAAQGNQQAIDAIAKHIVATDNAKAAVKALASVEEASIPVAASAAGSQKLYAASIDKVASAASHTVPQIAAASGAIRVLDGALPIRAVERFAVTTLGLGPILQAAFPVIGAIALGEVVVGMGEKLYTAFDLGGVRARKTAEEIRGVNLEIDRSTNALNVQIDRLQQEEARLEHKPFNGMKLVLDEAAEAADQLAHRLETVIDRERKAIAGMSSSLPQLLAGGSQTKYEQTMLNEHQKYLGDAKNTQDQLNESVSYGNSLQTRLADLKDKQALSNQQTEGIVRDYSNEINAVQQLISWQQQEQANVKATIALNQQQASTQTSKDARGDAELANKAAAARLKAMEEEYNAEKLIHSVTLVDEFDFWNQRLYLFTAGSQQYDTIIGKMAQIAESGATKAHAAIEKLKGEQKKESSGAGDDTVARGQAEIDKWILQTAEDATHGGDRWREYNSELAKSSEISAQMAANLQLAHINQELAIGTIDKSAASAQIAAIHTAEYTSKLKALEEQLKRINSDTALKPNEQAAQSQAVQNAISNLKGGHAVQGLQDTTTQAQAMAAPYLKAFDTINSGFLQVQRQMIMGTRSISRDFANMGANLVVSVAGAWEQMIAKQLAMEIRSLAIHAVTKQGQVAIDQTAAAQSQLIQHESAIKEALVDAKLAAVKGWKAGMSLPPPANFIAAPAFAAAAFTGAIALAAFETGGIVPNTGIAMVHANEAVLPAPLTNFLMNAATSNTSNNSTSANMTVNNHGMSDAGYRRMATRNAEHMVGVVRRGLRRQGRI